MKTVSGLFNTYEEGKAAVRALENAHIDRDNISIISRQEDGDYVEESDAVEGAGTGAGIGALAGGAGGLLAGLGMLTIPGIGPVVAAGWLATTITGIAAGAVAGGAAGGIIGALTDSGVSRDEADVYAESLRRGGTLVTARVDDTMAPAAARILDQANRVDWTARREEYEASGWSGFSGNAVDGDPVRSTPRDPYASSSANRL